MRKFKKDKVNLNTLENIQNRLDKKKSEIKKQDEVLKKLRNEYNDIEMEADYLQALIDAQKWRDYQDKKTSKTPQQEKPARTEKDGASDK